MQALAYVKRKLPNIVTISKIVTIHYIEMDCNFSFIGETHDFWEMVYADRGNVIVTADEREFVLRQGEVVFHRPNEYHNIRADGVHAPDVFIITFDTRSHVMRWFEHRVMRLPAELRHLLSRIIDEGNRAFDLPFFDPFMTELPIRSDAPVGAQQLIRLYLEQLLILLLREDPDASKGPPVFDSRETFSNHIAREILRILQNELYGTVTLDRLCDELHYGRTFLSRTFKQISGFGIKEYFLQMKISEAKRLIREHNHTFSEIATLLYFDSPQYFSRRFKQATGMTPGEYANSIRLD